MMQAHVVMLSDCAVQKQHSPEGAGLHPGDILYIVHVRSPKQGGSKKSAWQSGGALMHSLQVQNLYKNKTRSVSKS